MTKGEEKEKDRERRKHYGPSLCCALAQLPVGLFVSLLNSRTRITGSAPLGVFPDAYDV